MTEEGWAALSRLLPTPRPSLLLSLSSRVLYSHGEMEPRVLSQVTSFPGGQKRWMKRKQHTNQMTGDTAWCNNNVVTLCNTGHARQPQLSPDPGQALWPGTPTLVAGNQYPGRGSPLPDLPVSVPLPRPPHVCRTNLMFFKLLKRLGYF